jgi:hypothetical protein
VFSRVSRYRDLPDVVTTDSRGRAVRSRSLRLLPAVQGVLAHTVEEGDRLDHLADRYYGQPRSWWRIADANPELLSPDDLLGDGPRSTVVVPLEWEDPAAPRWSELLRALRDTPGVEDAAMGTAATGEDTVEVDGGVLRHRWAVEVAFNRLLLDPAAVADVAEGLGFAAGPPRELRRIGAALAVPPRPA